MAPANFYIDFAQSIAPAATTTYSVNTYPIPVVKVDPFKSICDYTSRKLFTGTTENLNARDTVHKKASIQSTSCRRNLSLGVTRAAGRKRVTRLHEQSSPRRSRRSETRLSESDRRIWMEGKRRGRKEARSAGRERVAWGAAERQRQETEG